MKRVKKACVTSLAALALSPLSAYSASQAECAIWICMPGGFPAGCGAAYSAMISRVKKRKPPLPAFSGCAVNPPPGSGSHMTFDYGPAAEIAPHQICTHWDNSDNAYCLGWKTVPRHYIKKTICQQSDNGSQPPNCVATRMYGDVFIEGTPAGPTFYW
jgi:hypothetical protein